MLEIPLICAIFSSMRKPKSFKPKKGKHKSFKSKPTKDRAERQALYHTKEWRNFRFKFLKLNKYCYCCNELSNVVDHVVVHKGDAEIFYDSQNMIPLCEICHNIITANFDRHTVQKLKEKAEWIVKQRELYNITRPVYHVKLSP